MRRHPAIFLLAAAAAFAQPPSKFVTLDIAATAPDLHASDLQLFDNNRRQPVLYCRPSHAAPRATAVVFDLADSWIKGPAWNQTVRAMRQFEQYLYFYAVTREGALLPVHELPKPDADSAPANSPWMDQVLPRFEAAWSLEPPGSRKAPGADFSQYLDLVSRLAAFPGRKSLVCIGCLFARSDQFDSHADPAWTARAVRLRQIADAFQQARVAVSVVGGQPAGNQIDNVGTVPIDSIGAFAEATGGRAYGAAEIAQAITEAVRDGRSTYRIAYLPAAENWDGKRHKLRVTTTRSGVRLTAPAWYIPERPADAPGFRPSIPDFAIASPFDQTDIAISVAPPEKTADILRLQIRVDAADLLFIPRNGRSSDLLAVEAVCYTAEGRRLACTELMRVNLDLSQPEFPLEVPLREAFSRIRILVHDENSGATGSATLTLPEVR